MNGICWIPNQITIVNVSINEWHINHLQMFLGKFDLTRRKMAIDLVILLQIWVICAFQVSLLSTWTPKNLVTLFSWISLSPIIKESLGTSFLKENIITFVFEIFKMSLFASSHSTTFFVSDSKVFLSWMKLLQLNINVVSSANWISWRSVEHDFISFTKKK